MELFVQAFSVSEDSDLPYLTQGSGRCLNVFQPTETAVAGDQPRVFDVSCATCRLTTRSMEGQTLLYWRRLVLWRSWEVELAALSKSSNGVQGRNSER